MVYYKSWQIDVNGQDASRRVLGKAGDTHT